MPYPLISEYIEAIKSAEDSFKEFTNLRPVLDEEGNPVMTSGNFAVVFKMKDEQSGKLYAVKCFTKEQEGRAEAYLEITKELKDVASPYLVSIQYLEEELFVDTNQTPETEFPILLMEWVEGKTLDKYLHDNLDDMYALEMLAYRFSQMALWLLNQPFAHGDLKPDNILVREDETLVLIDYDGMYVPTMRGQKARELGSPDFRHPQRSELCFDEYIDDFSIVSILLSLKSISVNPFLLDEYGASDRLLFSAVDYRNLNRSPLFNYLLSEKGYTHEVGMLTSALKKLSQSPIVHLSPYDLPELYSLEDNYRYDEIDENNQEILDFLNDTAERYREDVIEKTEKQVLSDMVVVAGVKYSKDMKCLLQCPDIPSYTILSGTKVIGDRAFFRCSSLAQVVIPDSVEYIGSHAFYHCEKLIRITLPDTVKSIGDNAFFGCKSLKQITIPSNVNYIGVGALGFCENLIQVSFQGSDIIIGNRVCYGCKSLARINIPIWSRRKFETQLPELKSRLIENRF